MSRRLVLVLIAVITAVAGVVSGALPAQAASAQFTAARASTARAATAQATSVRAAQTWVDWNWSRGFLGALAHPGTPPRGANDFGCRASGDKLPVILVHGTYEHQGDNWAAMSPFLVNNGFCVFTFNYGGRAGDLFWGYRSIADSAAELRTFVETVRAGTGSDRVDLVGHSQGGMMPRYYLKFLGGQGKVRNLVALGPSNHGTTLSGLADLAAAIGVTGPIADLQPALIDQTIGSPFQRKLNSCPDGPDADICPGDPTKYTVIMERHDQVVTPYTNGFLHGAKNITAGDECSLELAEHLGMTYSRNVAQMVLKALDPTVTRRVCVLSLPYAGG